ncbi:glycosyltransferase [Sangeribacter muris]|jgi:glycosyltransferase involved in cell wall biosynthesis|uniref:glycosyltransferase n=1 Tax=Sangeribacter muris TaxID=2880703 RepID=UPI000FFE5B08|nr:glycosyltransferase [Sangeribacter muris]RXE69688.1 glycosyltransferase [Muribaculaceae bacterium Isolate-001 (NCI)]
MKIALICKSDSTGGAAVVTFRLMNALRANGMDARMIVTEKKSGSPHVIEAASQNKSLVPFLAERLRIFAGNGFNRKTLFRIDTASDGLPLHRIPFVREADVICLNWVNQGVVSLKGIRKLAALGKPLVWTMHDMWNMTGICHHAGYCQKFLGPRGECGDCPLLEHKASKNDLSHKVWQHKRNLYDSVNINFVAVSTWLADTARKSSLMHDSDISVIPNAFDTTTISLPTKTAVSDNRDSARIIFGAARIDDPVKNHHTLVEATKILADKYPQEAKRLELVTFGSLKDPDALKGVAIRHTHLGRISPEEIRDIYESGSVVVSTSEWETLPGTLIEGQAWGCVPVALDHGGQPDIIDHLSTGYLAPWSDNRKENALRIAEGILWGINNRNSVIQIMQHSVIEKFAENTVAEKYIRLFRKLLNQ